jgi:hypothetical protein
MTSGSLFQTASQQSRANGVMSTKFHSARGVSPTRIVTQSPVLSRRKAVMALMYILDGDLFSLIDGVIDGEVTYLAVKAGPRSICQQQNWPIPWTMRRRRPPLGQSIAPRQRTLMGLTLSFLL